MKTEDEIMVLISEYPVDNGIWSATLFDALYKYFESRNSIEDNGVHYENGVSIKATEKTTAVIEGLAKALVKK